MAKFADDVSTLAPESNNCGMDEEFRHIVAWSQHNTLKLNLTKTKEIVFHRPTLCLALLPVPFPGIERVVSAKILGVTITSALHFSEHVNSVIQGCTSAMFFCVL